MANKRKSGEPQSSGKGPKKIKRHMKVMSLEEKGELIKEIKGGMSYAACGRHYGIKESTVSPLPCLVEHKVMIKNLQCIVTSSIFYLLQSFTKWDEIPSAEEHHSLQASVEQALANLSKQQEVMQGVYSTYIAPWTTSTTHLELPTTGPLVEETESKLSSLVKALKTTEEILHNCEKLEEQEKAILKASHHPSCISTTLHSLVAEAGRPQDGL
ncbi:hypothetical protein GWK47_054876 [Chionoecetes opilio]|uniref:HTH psq-type domain-containing protein n=1 Tax=Chionoecetes opilio TaxID=41210 RepID=A0A8J5CQF6_CHIOP|nr:hypothetical protein GWK47_054876 [Chionoecetes opilio]